jgi:hypothetical protein
MLTVLVLAQIVKSRLKGENDKKEGKVGDKHREFEIN